ncbi:Scr1 family TA system antitoxin-like transcriptional regulator [Nocardia sp. NPDC051990]|uniref:Scr1 family TA system antitoxin-like transcriptional regulator n=1 Tax=Nocardia sp. NPDC051990 TaxID=3155285 RepID=UPI0034384A7D
MRPHARLSFHLLSRTRDPAPLTVDLVLDEAVMRRIVGGPKMMSAQLRHLAELPHNVRVQVLPAVRTRAVARAREQGAI